MQKLILAFLFVVGVVGPAFAQPASVVARVVRREVKGTMTDLTIAVGSDRGIQATWKAYLVDADGNRIAGGRLVVLSVEEHMTLVRTNKGADEVRDLRVKLEP